MNGTQSKSLTKWKIRFAGILANIVLFTVVFLVFEKASLDVAIKAAIMLTIILRVVLLFQNSK